MTDFLKAIHERVLVLDGAMGTLLQEKGLKPGGCPEEMNLTAPDVVTGIHRDYAAAGADILVTNTFGGNRTKLAHYNLSSQVAEINRQGVELARRAAGDRGWVAASIGPTGRFVEPAGDATFDEMVEIFGEQVKALVEAGADLITLETFLDIRELRAAVIACHEFSRLPVMALMTFDDGGRSVLGTPPEAAAVTLDAMGVDVIGSNCGLGPEGIYAILEKMRSVTSRPLIAQPNAGLPELRDGKTFFPASPEEMTLHHDRLIALGARVLGGCCGTTPEHIRAIRLALEGRDVTWNPPPRRGYLSSRTTVVPFGDGAPCVVIGERINPTGKKVLTQELREGKTAWIRREALDQVAAGAALLDLNCGTPGTDEAASLERAVFAVNGVCNAPVVLDSSDPEALERGLRAADGKVLINSVSGERKSLEKVLPLARKYGAALIGLTLDEKGIPPQAAQRIAVAGRILQAAEEAGLHRSDLLIDALALTVSAEPEQPRETLRIISSVKSGLGLATVLGVSNVSFGLPSRPVLSSTFFAMALAAGLDAAIINPKDERMMDAYRAAMVLLGKDQRAEEYIAHFGAMAAAPASPGGATAPAGILEQLAVAVIEGDPDGIVPLVEKALAEGMTPLDISNRGLLPGLEEVGRRFGSQQIFLPQVMLSAQAMKAGFARLKEEMQGQDVPSQGKILMATVEGDIHDIGKNIVCTLLENHGFEVIDLGKNVPVGRILEAARKHAVDAVGLSALMTTTLAQMERTIQHLRDAGIRVFTMVGGAVVTQEYADSIGADLYAADALEAVEKIKAMFRQMTA